MDDGPLYYCKWCGDPIALYTVFDEPVCDCKESFEFSPALTLADEMETERDRLAAENAELLESLAEYAHAVGAGHPSPCTLGPLCPYCHIDGIDEQLAAANATLDKLRDLLPEGGVWCYACNRATVPIWGEGHMSTSTQSITR